jgi:hypothetical protein
MSAVLAYVSAVMVAVWGILHAVPTRQVLAGFQPITVPLAGQRLMSGRGFTAPHPGRFLAWQRSPR